MSIDINRNSGRSEMMKGNIWPERPEDRSTTGRKDLSWGDIDMDQRTRHMLSEKGGMDSVVKMSDYSDRRLASSAVPQTASNWGKLEINQLKQHINAPFPELISNGKGGTYVGFIQPEYGR